MRLRLYENHRFVLYAPFYAAYAVGAYAAERAGRRTLAVTGCRTGRAGPARRRGRRALGRADAGHEAPRREPCRGRPPRSVLDRRPIPQSGFPALRPCQNSPCHRLRGADTVAMSAGGSVAGRYRPGAAGSHRRSQHGRKPQCLERGTARGSAVFEPVVEEALASGRVTCGTRRAHVAVPLARFRDTRDRFVRDAEPLLSMVRAIQRTQQWIYSRSAPEIAETISSFFPALDRGVLAAALARYQAQSVWGRDPVLPENGFDSLRRYLVSGGFIRRPTHTQPASTIASPCKS